jgi:elongation factor Ts
VPADLIEKERSVAAAKAAEDAAECRQAAADEIVAKRIEGRCRSTSRKSRCSTRFREAADGKQTVEQMLKAANTTVKGFTLYVVGEGIEKKVDDFAAEVAAQVAAAKGPLPDFFRHPPPQAPY